MHMMQIVKTYDEAADELQTTGAVGILPTDTIYGVVARAHDTLAVERLYRLKEREKKPGTVIAANIDQLVELGIPRRYLVPVVSYWPNPVSIVVPTAPGLAYLDLGKFSLAVRIPADDDLRNLLEKTGPLLTSSANHAGEPPASTIAEAEKYFGGQVDFYIGGGTINKPASTVIRVVDDAVEVLREGAVKINENGEVTK
jgi:L-threonylcarbamoyladenylate synthase